MANIFDFKELKVWQKSHELVLKIYSISNIFPNNEKYGLTSQIQRASISIASNIVEGFNRRSVKESLHFYNISRGSLEEVRYQLLIAKDLQYIDEKTFTELEILCNEIGKMLYSWIKCQKRNSHL